jgi:hypothetical protein
MIEVSIAEIVLFAWAIIATGYALKYKQQEQAAKRFIRDLMEDDKMRDAFVKEFKEHMEGQT